MSGVNIPKTGQKTVTIMFPFQCPFSTESDGIAL